MTQDIDALFSALKLQGPGPGFAARTAAAFEKARQTRRIRQMLFLLCMAAGMSGVSVTGAYYAGWLNPAAFALNAGLLVANATMAVRVVLLFVAAAPTLWAASVFVAMVVVCVATTVALERSLRLVAK